MNKISVVVTGRNDNYDGDFDERLTIALSKNIKSLPHAEFLFIEWNPYLDRQLTSRKLKKVFGDLIKCYVVHPMHHEKYCTIDGFLEYPAKNVGVRKATGDYILCTNSDVIFSPKVVEKMTNGDLKWDTVYRATRVDIKRDYKDVVFPVKAEYKLRINSGLTNACGDFLMLHRDLWNWSTGYCEAFPEQRIHKDSFLVHILVNDHKLAWEDFGMITHWHHNSSWSELFDKRPGIGDPKWDFRKCGFTKNPDDWGLTFTREQVRDGITWLI